MPIRQARGVVVMHDLCAPNSPHHPRLCCPMTAEQNTIQVSRLGITQHHIHICHHMHIYHHTHRYKNIVRRQLDQTMLMITCTSHRSTSTPVHSEHLALGPRIGKGHDRPGHAVAQAGATALMGHHHAAVHLCWARRPRRLGLGAGQAPPKLHGKRSRRGDRSGRACYHII